MSAEIAVRDNVTVMQRAATALTLVEMRERVEQLDGFYRGLMQKDTDYGEIPGTNKPTLYQPGAQMLDQIFGYSPRFEILPSSVIDWQRPIPFFHYVLLCRLISLRSGDTVAEGIGSCNSYEDKYRWRNAKRTCPECKVEAIIKGKQEYGGGWLCFKRNNGCGAKFRDGDSAIESQQAGRVENEDTASLENTISKMAQKRAHIAATLNATGASRIFTQDIEDLPQFQNALVVESRSAPAPEPPADSKNRATFERNWKAGCDKAIAIGAVPPDKPGEDATVADLRAKQAELKDAIDARETLCAAFLDQQTEARRLGAETAQVDVSQATDQELHEMIATLKEMIAAASPDDDDSAPF